MIDLGKSGGENRAVTDLKLDVPGRDGGRDASWSAAVVHNFGGTRPTASASG